MLFLNRLRSGFQSSGKRGFSSAPDNKPAGYPLSMKLLHWGVGIPVLGAVGAVLAAQQAGKSPDKQFLGTSQGDWMWRHKSLALLGTIFFVPRVAVRLTTSKAALPGHVEGTPTVLQYAGDFAHVQSESINLCDLFYIYNGDFLSDSDSNSNNNK